MKSIRAISSSSKHWRLKMDNAEPSPASIPLNSPTPLPDYLSKKKIKNKSSSMRQKKRVAMKQSEKILSAVFAKSSKLARDDIQCPISLTHSPTLAHFHDFGKFPKLVSRATLVEKIGEGGQGSVFKAFDHVSNSYVAVKALTGRPITDLMDEANAVLSIMKKDWQDQKGIFIAKVNHLIPENGYLFIFMELFEGTLCDLAKDLDTLWKAATTLSVVVRTCCHFWDSVCHNGKCSNDDLTVNLTD